ncbi:hypothetical protein C0J52_16871 [Blattella germanica]|nr:hypothetical protein C0J52_16871 [Blattella germanica]
MICLLKDGVLAEYQAVIFPVSIIPISPTKYHIQHPLSVMKRSGGEEVSRNYLRGFALHNRSLVSLQIWFLLLANPTTETAASLAGRIHVATIQVKSCLPKASSMLRGESKEIDWNILSDGSDKLLLTFIALLLSSLSGEDRTVNLLAIILRTDFSSLELTCLVFSIKHFPFTCASSEHNFHSSFNCFDVILLMGGLIMFAFEVETTQGGLISWLDESEGFTTDPQLVTLFFMRVLRLYYNGMSMLCTYLRIEYPKGCFRRSQEGRDQEEDPKPDGWTNGHPRSYLLTQCGSPPPSQLPANTMRLPFLQAVTLL